MSGSIEVEHRLAGTIRVPNEEVLHFDPLPGFPDAQKFALMSDAEGSPYAWLICLDDLDLGFRVADPRSLFPDYDPFSARKLPSSFAGLSDEDLVLLAIVNLSGGTPRLNLAAPLVVDAKARTGRQVILDDDRYAVGATFAGGAAEPERLQPAPVPADQIESNPQR